MPTLPVSADPEVTPGTTIRRPDPLKPFVAMSNRHRWSVCALSAVLPQVRTPSQPAAAEGTEAHKVAEWAVHQTFKNGAPCAPPVVTTPDGVFVDPVVWQAEVLKHAQTYAQGAASLFTSGGSPLPDPTFAMVELKIEDVTIHGVRVYTVADAVFWNAGAKRLVVGDYKYGRGPVGVGTPDEPNEQCAGAAVLWVDTQGPGCQPKDIGLFVYQPRTREGEQRAWQVLAPLDAAWLDKERDKLHAELFEVSQAAAALAEGRMVAGVPGEHCKYCPSARWCNTAAGYGAKALEVEAGRTAVVELTPAEVMSLWGARSAFKQFEDDLRERVRMLHEAADPAVTVKRRAGNRVWLNPAAVVEQLMLSERFDLLQPPGIEAVTQSGAVAPEVLSTLTKRAPDVLTYSPTSGKDLTAAAGAFAKYLSQDGAP